MCQDTWSKVDAYLEELLIGDDDQLSGALLAAQAAGLAPINVSPTQGKFLHVLARLCRARAILEIGTLAGYSAIWLARALPPDGRLLSLEIDPAHGTVATANLARAGLADRAEVLVAPAAESLAGLVAKRSSLFDLVFIDADKASTPDYLEAALALTHPGSAIVIDNVVRSGEVLDASGRDRDVEGVRRALEQLATDPRLCATALQTVGSKGYDGLAVAFVTEES